MKIYKVLLTFLIGMHLVTSGVTAANPVQKKATVTDKVWSSATIYATNALNKIKMVRTKVVNQVKKTTSAVYQVFCQISPEGRERFVKFAGSLVIACIIYYRNRQNAESRRVEERQNAEWRRQNAERRRVERWQDGVRRRAQERENVERRRAQERAQERENVERRRAEGWRGVEFRPDLNAGFLPNFERYVEESVRGAISEAILRGAAQGYEEAMRRREEERREERRRYEEAMRRREEERQEERRRQIVEIYNRLNTHRAAQCVPDEPFPLSPVEAEEDAHCGGAGGAIAYLYDKPLRVAAQQEEVVFDEEEKGEEDEKHADEKAEDEKRNKKEIALGLLSDQVASFTAGAFSKLELNDARDGLRVYKKMWWNGDGDWQFDCIEDDNIVNARDATGKTVLDVMVGKIFRAYNRSREHDRRWHQEGVFKSNVVVRSRLEPVVALLRAGALPSTENSKAVADLQHLFDKFMMPSSQEAVLARCNRAHEAGLVSSVLHESMPLPSSVCDMVAEYLDNLIVVDSDSEEMKKIKQEKLAAFAWQREALGW